MATRSVGPHPTRQRPHDTPSSAVAGRSSAFDALGDTKHASLAESHAVEAVEGRRERHRRETFERLVRAAREIMFNRGFNEITVQDITDAADVGKGTFFNYFRSKEHVVSRVQEFNRRHLQTAVEQVRDGHQAPIDALTAMLLSQLCPSDGQWLTYQSNTMRALALHPDVRLMYTPELQKGLEAHEALIEAAQQNGSVRGDVPAADIAMITQTYFAGLTVLFWISGITPTPALVADRVKKLYKMLEPALSPPTSKPRRPKPRAVQARRSSTTRRAAVKKPATRRR